MADGGNNRVQVFTQTGQFVTKWGRYGGNGTSGTGDGEFNQPWGIAINGSGYIYVADAFNNRVQVFTQTGQFVTKWGRYGGNGSAGTGDGEFQSPTGIAINGTGEVYVVELWNSRVQVFTPSGQFITKWGSPGTGDGQLGVPQGITFNKSGSLYIADTGNDRVQVFTQDGQFLNNWGDNGSAAGEFEYPNDITVDTNGFVFVVDSDNNRIQTFTQTGEFLATWGTVGPANGQFSSPGGVVVNESGYVYVVDTLNERIQVFVGAAVIVNTGFVPGHIYNATAPTFALGISSINPVDEMWYSLDAGVTNTTCSQTDTLTTGWNSVSNGTVSVTFWANTTARDFMRREVVLLKDTVAPSIEDTGLTPGKLYGIPAPSYSLTITEGNLDKIWYTLDAGVTNTTSTIIGTLADQWGGQSEGPVTVTFYANDTAGNVNQYTIGIQKDAYNPSFTSTGFTVGQLCNGTAPVFSLVVVDTNLNETWYSLDGGLTNTTCALTDTLVAQWSGRPNGTVTVSFWANDTAGNEGTTSIILNKDIIGPDIVSTGLTPGQLCNVAAPEFVLSITEANLNATWYSLDGGLSNTTCNLIDSLAVQWGLHGNESVTVTFWANDTVGNIGTTSVVVEKDTTIPVIAEYLLFPYMLCNATPPAFSLEIIDDNPGSLWYSLDGGLTNTTCEANNSVTLQWDVHGNGTVIITFWGNDTHGNIGTSEITLLKDIIPPRLHITGINNGSSFIDPPAFSLDLEEANLDRVWYVIEGTSTKFYASIFDITIDPVLWKGIAPGNVIIHIYANDTLGNVASIQVNLTKTTPPLDPTIIEIIGTIVIIGVIVGVGTFIISMVRKRRKWNNSL